MSSLACACSATKSIGNKVSMIAPNDMGVIEFGLGGGKI